MLSKIQEASVIYTLGTLLTKGLRLLLLPVYLIYLSQEEIGILAISEAVIALITMSLSMGLPAAIQRFKFIQIDETSYFSQILTFKIGIGIVSFFILSVLAFWIKFQVDTAIIILSIFIGFLQSNLSILENKFIADEQPLKHRTYTFLRFLAIALGIIFVVLVLKGSVLEMLYIQAGILFIYNVHLFKIIPLSKKFSSFHIKESIIFGLQALPFGISLWGLNLSDRLILQSYVTLDVLSVYSVGYQLASGLSIVSMGIRDAWRPRLFKTYHNENEHFSNSLMFLKYTWLIFGFCQLIFFGTYLLFFELKWFIQYSESSRITNIVTIGLYYQALTIALISILLYFKRAKVVSFVAVLAFCLNITLNIYFIPIYGIEAAALITITTYLIQFIVLSSLTFKLMNNRYIKIGYLSIMAQSVVLLIELFYTLN
jgi:O-antigen/teichoic acid export membrane protein